MRAGTGGWGDECREGHNAESQHDVPQQHAWCLIVALEQKNNRSDPCYPRAMATSDDSEEHGTWIRGRKTTRVRCLRQNRNWREAEKLIDLA